MKKKTVKKIPEFTIDDSVIKPDEGYANFKGENRVFIIFITVSPAKIKLTKS